MKNNFIKSLFCLAIVAVSVVSCMDDDQNYPDPDKPIISANSTISINEGETASIVLNLSKPIGSPIDLKLTPVDGTASDSDYSVAASEFTSVDDGVGPVPAYGIEIPSGVSSFEVPLTALSDIDIDNGETIVFELSSTLNGKGLVADDSKIITVTINNIESTDLYIELAWSGNYVDADGDSHDFCDLDLDLELYSDPDYNTIIATSYSDCPESITIEPGDLADGVYYIVPSFYSNSGSVPPAENAQIPARMTFANPGKKVTTDDLSSLWDYENGGVDENGDINYSYYLSYELTVSGNTYSIKDRNGNTVF